MADDEVMPPVAGKDEVSGKAAVDSAESCLRL